MTNRLQKLLADTDAAVRSVGEKFARIDAALGLPPKTDARHPAPAPSPVVTRPTLLMRRTEALRAFLVQRGIPKQDWRHLRRHGLSRKVLHNALSEAAPALFGNLTEGGFRTVFLQKQDLVRIGE